MSERRRFYRDVQRERDRIENLIFGENVPAEPVDLPGVPLGEGEDGNQILEEAIPEVEVEPADDVSSDGGDSDGSDSSFDWDSDDEIIESFRDKIAAFVRMHNLSCEATKELLELLRANGHPELPRTRATLLHTPTVPIQLRDCFPGVYYHYGLQTGLLRQNYNVLATAPVIKLDINIDGVSLGKSSKIKLWPIHAAFVDHPNISPFIVGCYFGYADPGSINDFLSEFVGELEGILQNGCYVTPRRIHKPLEIRAYVLDGPARAFVRGVKGHASLYGCDKCHQKCITIDRKMTYRTESGPPRTDESFRDRLQVEQHQPEFVAAHSLIETLGTRMVIQFPIDEMHALHLGVMKRILKSLYKGTSLLSNDNKALLDTAYLELRPYVPTEFERKPRSLLNELSRFKAVELRFFLLYAGVVILKDIVSAEIYAHFLLLFTAIRFLSCKLTCQANAEISQLLLERFVEQYPNIYGPKELVYNVHLLLHLVNDIMLYGPLSSFSAYKFENYQREIKKHVKRPTQVLQQINNRLCEIDIVNEKKSKVGLIGRPRAYDNDFFPGCNSSYRGFKFDSFILQTNLQDSSCMTVTGIPIHIQQFVVQNDEQIFIAKQFLNIRSWFTAPVDSNAFCGIMLVDPPGGDILQFRAVDIKYKFVRIPYNNSFVLIPMLHHLTD